MTDRSSAVTIDEYIAEFPPETREVLEQLRSLISGLAPEATETISYSIPTFDLNGKHLVHFSGYAKHVGLYPTPSGMEQFKAGLAQYKTGKGSVQFPIDQPLPVELIRQIVEYRVGEVQRASATHRTGGQDAR